MSKQDRQGVRTAPELERRYGFGKSFREVRSGIQTADKAAEQALHTAASAAETAQNSKAAIEGMTVEARTLAPGSAATVEKTNIGGVTNLNFGIPKGEPGKDAPADTYLPYAGGVMTGPIFMGGNAIREVREPAEATDAANKAYVDGIFPPMLLGQEYRTAERWRGKPVYRKLIRYTNAEDIGTQDGAADVSIDHGIAGMEALVRCHAQVGTDILPYLSENGGMTVVNGLSRTKSALILRICNNLWTPREWLFDMAYTKEETT